jgi:hypothetical protein
MQQQPACMLLLALLLYVCFSCSTSLAPYIHISLLLSQLLLQTDATVSNSL